MKIFSKNVLILIFIKFDSIKAVLRIYFINDQVGMEPPKKREKMDIKENTDLDFFEIEERDTNFLTFNKISIKTQSDILYLSFDFHKDKIFNSILKMNFKILVDEFFKIWSFEKCFYDSFIEVEDLKNDDQEDVLCDVIERIYTLNIDGNEYSSFGWKIKNDHDFIQQLHIIFRICKIHKVNIFDYTILHEPIADILSRIAESIEKIDFFTTLYLQQ
ncbi:hypothetical protein CWI38_0439p0020 [Hamiltosporidium tvaerminnensis]|uniref:Uncharacterized protein n=1 Tax=Hamiltosporidium tvaerminnensis TaxID=1176355 RepID=A0A4Q9LXA2_9MICR|nr:hypothetical protein CWI38_0439p0020 [Hamiltosporidium tvaerminnensis]